jgi:hypothetical protein
VVIPADGSGLTTELLRQLTAKVAVSNGYKRGRRAVRA